MLIYKITNKLNGMIYIGQTSQTFEERMLGHKYGLLYVDQEINKYGIEHFTFEIIEECDTKEELNERERYWIAYFNCKSPNGYNFTDGGNSTSNGRKSNEKNINFADRLKYLRKHQKLSQMEVCERTGISQSAYSRYECGTNEPDLQTLKKLAMFFDCTVDYLLEIEGTPDDAEKVVDLNDFILNGKYTISSKFPNNRDRRIINSLINSVYRIDEIPI